MWDPTRYRQFGAERSRPFYELVARIGATEPEFVTDLGCGPGELTADLCARWPAAQVLGVDSSADMIAAATEVVAGLPDESRGRLRFELADVSDWEPGRPVDVIVSNAMLQWLPEHEKLLPRWVGHLAPGGWLAFAVPGNFDQPTHRLLRELAELPNWRDLLAGVAFNRQAADPAEYLDLLAREGCAVDAWETTYLHVLEGDDPVLDWYKGTGLRPVIAALDKEQAAEFMAEYGALLRKHYPRRPYGTVLPFRRVFVVAQKGVAW
jgi:trans-aconitate 2-methyltransferase